MLHRVAYIEFITVNGQIKRLDGIDFEFSISKSLGTVMNEATISIFNLSKEDIEYLTTFTSQWIAYNQRKRIRIFAGYQETAVGLIYDGDIVEALPTLPPDIILRCKAFSGAYGNSTIISKSITEQISVKDLLTQVSSWTGKEVLDNTTSNKTVNGFYYTGSVTQLIRQLNEIGGISVYEDDGVINAVDSNNIDIGTSIRLVSENNGMIEIPQPNAIGINVKILLDPTIKIGQVIKVESKSIPACNGLYSIYEMKHSGALRSNHFYTDIMARRKSNE